MIEFTPNRIGILLELMDEKDHANWELTHKFKADKGNIFKVLQQLEKKGLIEKRGSRKTTKHKSRRPGQQEIPYYLVQNIAAPFQADDIEHPITLMLNLFNQEYATASDIRERLPALSDFKERSKHNSDFDPFWGYPPREALRRTLVDELNTLIQGSSLFDRDTFKNVILRPKTKDLIKEEPEGDKKTLLNRLLIEDTFPYAILKRTGIRVCYDLILYLIRARKYDELEQFLRSNYIDNIIENDGLFSFHKILEGELVRKEVRLAVSKSLLALPSVKKQFKELTDAYIINLLKDWTSEDVGKDVQPEMKAKYGNMIPRIRYEGVNHSDIEECRKFFGLIQRIYETVPWDDVEFEVLSKYDPLTAIHFCRDNILEKFKSFYSELEKRSLITAGLRKFLETDAYLSPFTSFPVNDPEGLLFSPPFQRIYENAYLLGDTDKPILIRRARVIYDHFTDLLLDRQRALARSYLNSHPDSVYKVNQDVLAMETRSFLFYWNTIGTRFDR